MNLLSVTNHHYSLLDYDIIPVRRLFRLKIPMARRLLYPSIKCQLLIQNLLVVICNLLLINL